MAQEINSDFIGSLEITKDSYRGFHIKIIKPVECKEFIQFVDEFCQR